MLTLKVNQDLNEEHQIIFYVAIDIQIVLWHFLYCQH